MSDYELKPRSSFWFTRLLNKFGGGVYWTTVGNTIYYPDVLEGEAHLFTEIIEHEKVHIKQYKKYSVPLFLFLYCLVPLPVFFAYFRWKFEREAYLVQIRAGVSSIDEVVNMLYYHYGFVWPKDWMREWFIKNE